MPLSLAELDFRTLTVVKAASPNGNIAHLHQKQSPVAAPTGIHCDRRCMPPRIRDDIQIVDVHHHRRHPITGRKARKTEPVKDPCHELA